MISPRILKFHKKEVLIHITSHAAGMFKPQYLPQHRGFNFSTGMLSGASDHYTHMVAGAYDWHAMESPNFAVDGRYGEEAILAM